MNDPHPTPRAPLAVLLALSFGVRLAWGLTQPAEIDSRLPDQAEYLQLGRNLLHNRQFSFIDERFGAEVYAYRTPGYPALIAACGANLRVLRAVQAAIDTSTVLAAFLLARRWLAPQWALATAIFVAANPFLIYFSGLVLSETLFTAMLIWGVVLLVRVPGYFFGGAVLALSVLVRPSAVALPVMLGCATRILCPPPAKPGGLVPVGLGMILLTVAVLFPWAARNRGVLGEWVWLTTNNGITRYDGFNPNATGASDQSFLAWPELRFLSHLSETDRDRTLASLADQSIRRQWYQDPSGLVRLALLKIARTWSPIPLSSEFGARRLYLIVAMAYAVPLYLLVLAGLCRGKLPAGARVLLILPALYFTVVHAASVGSLRYRMPVEPILAVVAGAGLAWTMERLSLRQFPGSA
ncbi:MAG: ArnT family glycosyltransferase [Tepidisphaerales bacterium]